jgi:transposase
MITPQSRPTDPRECHELLTRLAQQVNDLDQQLGDLRAALDQAAKLHDQTVEAHKRAVDSHKQTIDELKRQLELYRRYIFGPRRERLVDAPGQGHLFELHEPGAGRRGAS